MEEAFRSGILDKPAPKPSKETFSGKKEDVDLIVRINHYYYPKVSLALRVHA